MDTEIKQVVRALDKVIMDIKVLIVTLKDFQNALRIAAGDVPPVTHIEEERR